jgi:hypothetical protein
VSPSVIRPAAAVGVLVVHGAVDDVGDGFEAAVRVPRGADRLARSQIDLAHVVEVDERVEFGHRHAGEAAAYRESFALVAAGCGGQPAHRADPGRDRVERGQAGQDEYVVDGDGRHGGPLSDLVSIR